MVTTLTGTVSMGKTGKVVVSVRVSNYRSGFNRVEVLSASAHRYVVDKRVKNYVFKDRSKCLREFVWTSSCTTIKDVGL